MVDIRLNVTITTTTANQEFELFLELGQGGFSYQIPFAVESHKVATTVNSGSYKGIYVGDDNTRLNGGQFIFCSADNATLTINGWYCKVLINR
jgi:hypothetical protein